MFITVFEHLLVVTSAALISTVVIGVFRLRPALQSLIWLVVLIKLMTPSLPLPRSWLPSPFTTTSAAWNFEFNSADGVPHGIAASPEARFVRCCASIDNERGLGQRIQLVSGVHIAFIHSDAPQQDIGGLLLAGAYRLGRRQRLFFGSHVVQTQSTAIVDRAQSTAQFGVWQ